MPTSQSNNTPTSVSPPMMMNTSSPCPVTIPDPSSLRYGHDALSVILSWPEGKILIRPEDVQADGSLGMKFPWRRGVEGKLTIEGRRLDAPAPPLHARIPDGYGDIGFQSTVIYFPTEGCWEVTGRVGDASLTFVTLVARIPFKSAWPAWLPKGMIFKDRDVTIELHEKELRL